MEYIKVKYNNKQIVDMEYIKVKYNNKQIVDFIINNNIDFEQDVNGDLIYKDLLYYHDTHLNNTIDMPIYLCKNKFILHLSNCNLSLYQMAKLSYKYRNELKSKFYIYFILVWILLILVNVPYSGELNLFTYISWVILLLNVYVHFYAKSDVRTYYVNIRILRKIKLNKMKKYK
jgi:AraC-like DNA-binding protein